MAPLTATDAFSRAGMNVNVVEKLQEGVNRNLINAKEYAKENATEIVTEIGRAIHGVEISVDVTLVDVKKDRM